MLLPILFFSNLPLVLVAQVNGDYRTNAATVTWTTTGNWQKRVAGVWAASPDYPGQNAGAGTIWIQGGTTVNLNVSPANSIGAITFNTGNTSTLNITTFTLSVSGAVTYSIPNDNNNKIINISSGTLTCGSIIMPALTNNRNTQLNIGTGTVTVAGSVTTNTAARNSITFSGAGILNVAGDFTGPGSFTCNASTVNYNGNAGSQTVGAFTYYNLNCTNSAARTTSGTITVNNNANLSGGSLTLGANIAVAGAILVDGATLDCRTYTVTGGSFELANTNTSTLISANTAGITSSGATGSIQTTSRTYNEESNYIFNAVTTQSTGNGLPAIINNFTIDNVNGVNLSQDVTVEGMFTLTNGSIDIGNYDLTLGTLASITGSFGPTGMILTSGTGSLIKQGNSAADFIMTYPVGSGGYYTPMTLSAMTATVNPGAFLSVHAVPIQRVPSNSALNKYWSVATSNLTFINAAVSFIYDVSEVEGAEANYVTRRFDGSSFLVPEGATVNTTSKVLSAIGVSVLTGDWTAIDPEAENTTIDGSAEVFLGHTQVYTIAYGYSNYNWIVSGGTITAGQGTNSVVINWDATAGEGNLAVSYTQNGFNVSIPTLTVTRKVFPLSCFQYYRSIDIKGSMVNIGPLTNFPIMVNVTNNTLKSIEYGGHITHNAGYDIYFALDAAGTQPLEYQLDYYNPSTGQLVAWVKMNTLTNVNSNIYIFYGNYSITFDASTSSVWGVDLVGVYHMGQSTGDFGLGSNDGVNVGASIVTGRIGEGRLFNRTEKDFIQITNEPVFNFGSQMTVSFWMRLNSYPAVGNDWMDYIVKGDNKNWRFVGNRPNSTMYYCFGNEYTDDLSSANNSVPLSNWIHIAGTFNGNNTPLPLKNLFVNGVKVSRTANHTSISGYLTDNSPVLVGINSQAQDTRAFDGIMDELRISNQFKSDDWIITEYRNQSDLTNVSLSASGEQTLTIASPATGGTASATPNTLFAREYSSLTLTGHTGTSIQWQTSSDNINFIDLFGKTSNPQQTDPLLATTYFRAMVGSGGCPSASASTLITVTPPFITCSTGKRKKIIIDDTRYAGSDDLSSFPFLLQINNDADLRQTPAGKVQSAVGWDIRFTSSDGVTLLPQQVESYNPVTGSILVWVQIPVIYANQNTEFYMYYGDAAYAGSDPSISAVFGSEYLGVYHMGTGTGKNLFELNDASESSNNAVNTGTSNEPAGKIGAASIFSGAAQYITLPDESLFDIPYNGKLTISSWVYINPYSGSAYAKYFDKGAGSWTLRRDNGTNRVEMRQNYQNPEYISAINTNGIATSGWHYMVSTFDHTVNNMVVYIDGSSAASSKNVPANQLLQNNDNQVRIGSDAGVTPANYFRGNMDEVRIQNVARTSDWIKFEYDNMSNPVGFANVSAETSCNLGAPTPGTASANKTTLCIGQSATLTLTGYTGGIYWQKSTDNINWSFITGTNNPTLNTGVITRNTYYRASVSNCCEAFSNTVLISYAATSSPSLSFATTDVRCNGESNGTIDLTVTSGSGSYNYEWSTTAVTEDISSLSSATYTVLVTDISNSCSESGQAIVNQPSALSVTVTKTDETCPGFANGTASATPSGGIAPYSYLWSNSETTATITSLSNGLYNVIVTDNNNCTANSSVTIDTTYVAPLVPSANNQDFCNSATIAELVSDPGADGDVVDWYSDASGGVAMESDVSLTNGSHYYGQTRNSTTGCISLTRIDIAVTINPLPPTSLIYHD